jgi:hypothetical protein
MRLPDSSDTSALYHNRVALSNSASHRNNGEVSGLVGLLTGKLRKSQYPRACSSARRGAYRGTALRQLRGRYVFGDWSKAFGTPDGTLFVASPTGAGLWPMQELNVSTSTNGRLNHFLLGFGQDEDGEVYVLTTDRAGPTGTTGRVYRLALPDAG